MEKAKHGFTEEETVFYTVMKMLKNIVFIEFELWWDDHHLQLC